MKLYYNAIERDSLERAFSQAADESLSPALELAWSLRQLDPQRALHLLAPWSDHPDAAPWWRLIRADLAVLEPDLPSAGLWLSQAQSHFRLRRNPLGLLLSRWIQTQHLADQGAFPEAIECLATMQQEAEALGDGELRLVALWARAQLLVLHDTSRAEALMSRAPQPPTHAPLARALHEGCLSTYCTQQGHYSEAISHASASYHLFLDLGHTRRTITSCCALAYNFGNLGDHGHALNWVETGLRLAESRHWVGLRLACLAQMADTLARQQQLPAAQAVYEQALALTPEQAEDRTSNLLRTGLAEVLLRQGQADAALPLFERVLAAGHRAGHFDVEIECTRNMSQALFMLGESDEAMDIAEAALMRAREQQYAQGEIDLLRHLARMLMQQANPDAARALDLLQRALHLCLSRQDVSYGLWQELAQAQASQGQLPQAYESVTKALLSCMTQQTLESQQRSLAMQAQFQVQEIRHENEQLRQHHADEQARYELLQQNHQTLATITDIGRSLTALRDVPSLFAALHAQLGRLLRFDTLLLVAMDDKTQRLRMVAGIENGEPMPTFDYALSDPDSLSARCAREKRLLVIQQGVSTAPLPGTRSMASMLFAPLLIGDRVTGVLSVQTLPADAFGEREQQLLQMLATYLAIAIDNVMAYERVARLQAELSERQRLASLGSLVAGIAHELNTPLGNALLAVGSLRDAALALANQVEAGSIRRTELTQTSQFIRNGADLADRNLSRAAGLIDVFKGLAAHQPLSQRLPVQLQALVAQTCAPLQASLQAAGVSLQLALADAPPVLADPQTLAEVVHALTVNVIEHAQARHLRWHALPHGDGLLRLVCEDDGLGMSESVKARVFDPFFSTRFGQGSNGLGLTLVMHKVRVLLGGDMGVQSAPGQGSSFWMALHLAPS